MQTSLQFGIQPAGLWPRPLPIVPGRILQGFDKQHNPFYCEVVQKLDAEDGLITRPVNRCKPNLEGKYVDDQGRQLETVA